MKIHGYRVFDYKLITDGNGNLVKADRPCCCCLGSESVIMKASLEGMWEEVRICENCMIKGGLFLDYNDLKDALDNEN